MKNLVLLTTVAAGLNLALISSASAETYGGDATAVQVTVPATGTTIRAATGTLSISGGGEEASMMVGDIPGGATGGVVALTAGVMHSAIYGVGRWTSGDSSTGDVTLAISGNQITSDFIMARSKSHCQAGPHVSGDSTVENLVINGTPITVTGAPNQTVTLSNGTVVINEQTPSIVGNTGEIRTTALHVITRDTLTGALLADVMLATVDSKQGCEEEPDDTETFAKGAGTILAFDPTQKAKFGFFVGRPKGDGTFKGHLVYKDPSAGVDLRVYNATIMQVVPPPDARRNSRAQP